MKIASHIYLFQLFGCVVRCAFGLSPTQRMGGPLSKFFDKLERSGDLSSEQANHVRTNYRDVSANVDAHGSSYLSSYSNGSVREYLLKEFLGRRMNYETLRYMLNLLRLVPKKGKTQKKNEKASPVVASYSSSVQNSNEVEFLGLADPADHARSTFGDVRYNGIWHYAVGSREYVLQCHSRGLYIVDISEPSAPIRVQFISMPGGSIWRDVETYEAENGITYAYVAAQSDLGETPGTLFVVNLSSLSGGAPNLADSNPCAFVEYSSVQDLGHTVTVATNGLLLLNSANGGGCDVYDISETPWSPSYIGQSHQGALYDCHDSYARIGITLPGMTTSRDLLYSADGLSGRFTVVDITDIRQGQTTVLGQSDEIGISTYAHFGFPSEDGRYLYAFEESNTYDMAIFDVSDPSNIVLMKTFQYSEDSSYLTDYLVHNGQVRGNRLFVAYYEAGLRVFDITDPTNPVETGFYDTHTSGDFGFSLPTGSKGAWNVNTMLSDDKLVVSDQDSGTHIFRVREGPSTPRSPLPPTQSPPVQPPAPFPSSDEGSCNDVPGYEYCFLFEPSMIQPDPCVDYSGIFPEALSNCCSCGGGIRNGQPPASPAQPQDPSTTCMDAPGTDCSIFEGWIYFDPCETLGLLVPQATLDCCECGGGIVGDSDPRSNPVPVDETSEFTIEFEFVNDSTRLYENVFLEAATTLSRIILNDLPDFEASKWPNVDLSDGLLSSPLNTDVDDVLIIASVLEYDGLGNVLGVASPLVSRADGQHVSPISGVMLFDLDDFNSMDIMDIRIVVLHEMLHVLGLGSYWDDVCATACETQGASEYTCPAALEKYAELGMGSSLQVSDTGGDGSMCSHWNDISFNNWRWSDIMTPSFDQFKDQLITVVTIAALADLGYTVNYGEADTVPTSGFLSVVQSMFGVRDRPKLKPTRSFKLESSMVPLSSISPNFLSNLEAKHGEH